MAKKHGCGAAIFSHNCLNHQQYPWLSQIMGDEPRILLIQRGVTAPTFPGYWAFPGGLLDEGETLSQAAAREAQEEVAITFCPDEEPFWEGEAADRNLSYFNGSWWAPEKIIIQEDEVAGYGWFTLKEALSLNLAFRYREVIESLR